ncbi:hypothetical protein DL89DRAFT_255035 [Linderina pennispora]|uniref:Uncharacterized protein n=1 Tax=Linderina pennispora TaxID=61395 RepID=A0A1Y1WH18_9FUNG|nr:uncharacterized protein DL89DRAFT_255035 [Linderina pennispora]ORX72860.1 hypothetical protein DL89DRAFT_255035 [Linderina pennispora]
MGEPYLGVARILHNLLVHAAHEMHSVAVVCALQTVKQIAVQEGSAGAAAQRALAEVAAKMCAMAGGNANAQDRVCLVYCLFHGWAVAQSGASEAKRCWDFAQIQQRRIGEHRDVAVNRGWPGIGIGLAGPAPAQYRRQHARVSAILHAALQRHAQHCPAMRDVD